MERLRSPEQEPVTLQSFIQTFVNRSDAYPWQQPDGTYIAVRKPLITSLIAGHLKGQITFGTYALNQENMAKWVCFDADTDEQWSNLSDLALKLERLSIPLYRELSRRGGHLWLFTHSVPGLLMHRFARQILIEHGLDPDTGSPKPIEIYPRQTQLVDNGLGSLLRLPLGVHRKTGKIYPFVDANNKPLARTPNELLPIIVNPTRVPLPFFMRMIARSPQIAVSPPTPTFVTQPIEHLKNRKPSERILAVISTLNFVRQYVDLDGQNKGYCPFHDDEHKSFNVVKNGNYWNCFAGCGGGNIIHFWSRWRVEHGQDGSFIETIRDLLQLFHL